MATEPSDPFGAKLKLLAFITRQSDGQRVAAVRSERSGNGFAGSLSDQSRIANTGKQEVAYHVVVTAKGSGNAVAFSELVTLTVRPPAEAPEPGV